MFYGVVWRGEFVIVFLEILMIQFLNTLVSISPLNYSVVTSYISAAK